MAVIRADAAPQKKKPLPWLKVMAPLAACCAIVLFLRSGPVDIGGAGESAAPAAAYAEPAEVYDMVMEEAETEPACASDDMGRIVSPTESLVDAAESYSHSENADCDSDGKTSATLTCDDAGSTTYGSTEDQNYIADESAWVLHENVVFSCVVYLSPDYVGTVLDEYEGKPFSNARLPEYGVIGTGYAMEQEEFERILYEELDYLHGPMLNQERTTDLCCIVVTNNPKFY